MAVESRASTQQVNLAVIGFDGLQLLVPQTGIATIEMIENVEPGEGALVGSLRAGGLQWPVYALDADFNPQRQCAPGNRYCVAFRIDGQPAFALACDTVSSLTLGSFDEIKPLQDCMRNPRNPLEAMLLKDGQLMLFSQVEALGHFLAGDVAA